LIVRRIINITKNFILKNVFKKLFTYLIKKISKINKNSYIYILQLNRSIHPCISTLVIYFQSKKSYYSYHFYCTRSKLCRLNILAKSTIKDLTKSSSTSTKAVLKIRRKICRDTTCSCSTKKTKLTTYSIINTV